MFEYRLVGWSGPAAGKFNHAIDPWQLARRWGMPRQQVAVVQKE